MKMNVNKIEKQLFSEDYNFSPCFIINRFNLFIDKYGVQTILKKSIFKRSREMWISAVFCLGVAKMSNYNYKYWAKLEYNDDTPDTHVISYKEREDKKGNIKEDYFVEITDWISDDELINTINKKLLNNKYPSFFILLVYCRQINNTKVDLESIHQKIKMLDVRIQEIWFLTSIKSDKFDHRLVRLYPDRAEVDILIKEEMEKNKHQSEMLTEKRAFGTQLHKLGTISLPIPDIYFD